MSRPLAAVFDLDGTLVDNMSFHGDTWMDAARRLGSSATRQQFEHEWAGRKSDEIFATLLGRAPAPGELARLIEEKEHAYRTSYAPHLAPLAGLIPFLDRLAAGGIRLAVATAAPPENRELVLGGLGLRRRFEVVVGAEEAPRGKPAPDLFLAAARRLGLDPARCLAFEDASNGVLSARAAGMEAVGVLTSATAEALRSAGARFVTRDFATLPAEVEAYLFGAPDPVT